MTSWRSAKVGDIAQQIRGVTYAKEDASKNAKNGFKTLLRAMNITDNGLSLSDLIYVPNDRVAANQMLKAGDVLIAASSGSLNSVGKSSQIPQKFDGTFGAFCKVLRPNARVDANYFAHFFRTPSYREKISSLAAGANINNLRNEHLDDLDFPLPALPEQRRIAAILDQADALRAKRRAALAQLDEIARAIFVEMFNSPGSSAWPTVAIGSLAKSMRTGPFGSQLLHSEFTDAGVAVLGIDNAVSNDFSWGERRYVSHKKYSELARFRVFPKDVIVTIMGTCGRAAVVPNDISLAITTKHLCSITLDTVRCIPEYLHSCLLLHSDVQRQLGVSARGAVMPGLNMGLIRGTMVPLPPTRIQHDFANRLKAIQAARRTGLRSMEQLDGLFASLQHRAFAGEP